MGDIRLQEYYKLWNLFFKKYLSGCQIDLKTGISSPKFPGKKGIYAYLLDTHIWPSYPEISERKYPILNQSDTHKDIFWKINFIAYSTLKAVY